MKGTTIFSDFLQLLGVPHTGDYSDGRFRQMSFKSLFGLSRLLTSYGVDNAAYRISDKDHLPDIPCPFLAQQGSGFVIVKDVAGTGDDARVDFIYYHEDRSLPAAEFKKRWSGVVLTAAAGADAMEPQYARHHFYEVARKVKSLLLAACVVFLLTVGFIYAGLWKHLSTIFLAATDFAGLAVCWLLILKSLKIKSHAADRMCGILQEHGCDTVLEQKSSTFFGLFSWSEVGMAFFSVSTLLLFIFPQTIHYLALINGCCLPFTLWSISYQKFVIKSWCTLCVTVQCLLWLQFFCFFFGGWWRDIFPLRLELFLMGAAYLGAMLALNKIMPHVVGGVNVNNSK